MAVPLTVSERDAEAMHQAEKINRSASDATTTKLTNARILTRLGPKNYAGGNFPQVKPSGIITFAAQPANNDTITVNGVVFTFKTVAGASPDIQIGANLAATLLTAAAILNASVNASVASATYGSTATTITISHDTPGTTGNAFTLAENGADITVSGATLTGGVD